MDLIVEAYVVVVMARLNLSKDMYGQDKRR